MLRVLCIPASMLFLLAALAPGTPVPRGAEGVLYFPTKVGTKWTYANPFGESVKVVTGVERTDRGRLVSVGAVGRDGRVVPGERVLVSDRGLAEVGKYAIPPAPDGWGFLDPVWKPYGSPMDVLRSGARPGDSWEARPEDGFHYRYTDGGRERVRVPAGEFDARVVNLVQTVDGLEANRLRGWYAPGVGGVKYEHSRGETVLKSFTPGTD